jgi:hypothetical protein
MFDTLITRSRIDGYSKIIFWMFWGAMLVWTIMSLPDLIDPRGKPVGYDFMAFWSASFLALQDRAAEAYDPAYIIQAHNAAIPGLENYYLWHYPPTYFLTVLPLAMMPYLMALGVFLAASIAAWRSVVRRVMPLKEAKWAILALPAALVCIVHGQNGLLTAALLGGALLTLDRKPILSGVLIGLLVIKPHLGLLIPIALIAARRWTTFVSAAVTVVVFCLAATAVFGIDLWFVFFENLGNVRGYVDSGWLPWGMIPSPYVLARSLHVAPDFAMAIQLAALAAAALAVWRVWSAPGASFNLKAATLCAGTMLISPYVFYYDMTILALAGFWLVREGMATGFRPGEKSWLVMAWAAPLFMGPIEGVTGVQPAVAVIFALLWFAYRRARSAEPAPVSRPAMAPA